MVNKKVEERLGEKTKDLNEIQKNNLIKNISLSALKVVILKSKPGLSIDFDLENSLNFEGNTGPYLLYTYARANSILEKVNNDFNEEVKSISINSLPLYKKLIESESIIKRGIEELSPQLVVKYLFELAQAFNTFYGKEKIISEDKKETNSNIILVKYFLKVFKSSLNTIGIEEVERM